MNASVHNNEHKDIYKANITLEDQAEIENKLTSEERADLEGLEGREWLDALVKAIGEDETYDQVFGR